MPSPPPIRWLLVVGSLALLLTAGDVARGQLFFPTVEPELSPEVDLGDNSAARGLLTQVDALIANRQWDEAVETLRRTIDTHGDQLIVSPAAAEGGFPVHVTVRRHGFWLLSGWAQSAPEALELYRRRVDPLAELWLREARQRRDPALLRRIVDEAFVSRQGDEALDLLGQHALAAGRYSAARRWWQVGHPLLATPPGEHPVWLAGSGAPLWLALRGVDLDRHAADLAPLAAAPPPVDWLAYPDSDLPLAAWRARLALASILAGERRRAEIEVELVARLHGEAEGRLAGRTGRYADIVRQLLDDSATWPPPPVDADWPTLAGGPDRNGRAPWAVDVGPPRWSRPLTRLSSDNEQTGRGRPRVAERFDALLSHHVAVVGGLVLACDLDRIYAWRLADGEAAWSSAASEPFDVRDTGAIHRPGRGDPPPRLPRGPYVGVPRFTVTVDGSRLYARMGSPVTGVREEFLDQPSLIVGRDLARQGTMLPGFPLTPPERSWAFEGTPLAADERLYVALRHGEARTHVYVACYDALSGRELWRRRICSAQSRGLGQRPELTHNLLTLDDGVLYYNTNLGVVAALEAERGELLWATGYPRTVRGGDLFSGEQLHLFRDVNPAVVHGGLVLVAPTDCDRIFALDAATGRLVWQTPPGLAANAIHLLGVGRDRLLASGQRLYWFDVWSGKLLAQFPEGGALGAIQAPPSPSGYGRGVLAGDLVYWPTRSRIYVFEQATLATAGGSRPIPVQEIEMTQRGENGQGGHLVVADGVLLVAEPDRLMAYEAPQRGER